MHYYFITGTSSGIGKALALELLNRIDVCVIGISRTCTIEHNNYEHFFSDLSDPSQVSKVIEELTRDFKLTDSLYLINNAGILDPIRYAQFYSEDEIQKMLQVNFISSIQLISAFLKIPNDGNQNRIILSVSSGAATKVIDGWSLYGATKAGLEHFSKHVALELELKGITNTRIFSVAPGVVDTPMQKKIRDSNQDSFSTLGLFLELQASNQLVNPKVIAQKYCNILDKPSLFPSTIFSLRDII